MNRNRLACLKAVIAHPMSSVGEIAGVADLPENQASMNLRSLQARGLLSVTRKSRWVYYSPDSDPQVEHAATVLEAMRLAFRSRSDRNIRLTLTAFTHVRRLTILSALSRRPSVSVDALVGLTHISRTALCRHLRTLQAARFVVAHDDETWSLSPVSSLNPLAYSLLGAIVILKPLPRRSSNAKRSP
jgi:DNA-binding IclR family transcriptional regulator